MLIPGPTCVHGYRIALTHGAVRHVPTHGVCVINDEAWRADKAKWERMLADFEAQSVMTGEQGLGRG